MVPNAPGTSYQRWFKGDNDSLVVTTDNTQQQWSTCDLSVFRDDTTNAASVGIRMSGQNRAEITASLLPHELRDLATRLLDAAADIEAHPAPRRDFLASVEGVYA